MASMQHALRTLGRQYKVIATISNQQRCMSKDSGGGGQRNFLKQFYDNVMEGFQKDKEMKESLKKFREEREKLEQSEALKKARQKFEKIEHESSKTSENVRKTFEGVKGVLSEKLDDVSKTEYIKKGKELTEGLGKSVGKTAGKAAETISKTGQRLGESAPIKTSAKFFREEFKDIDTSKLYLSPVELKKRSDFAMMKDFRVIEANDDAKELDLTKESKFSRSWQEFKESNSAINKMFEIKMKYDESDHVAVRATKFFTDKISSVFGGMFTPSQLSQVITEINKIDPDFCKETFIRDLYKFIIPNILEAMLRGDLEILEDWCFEGVFNVLSTPIKEAKKLNYVFDSKVLDVSDVDVLQGQIMDQGPVLSIMFHSQQILVLRNQKGEVVEGDPDKVMRVTYIWALCRDQEEYDPRAAWKLIDISAQQSALLF